MVEISSLVKDIETEFGVTAAAPMMAMAVVAAAAAAEVEEKTEFDVILKGVGSAEAAGHQGRPRADRSRPEGGQGARRQRSEAAEGEGLQGRGRDDQGEARPRPGPKSRSSSHPVSDDQRAHIVGQGAKSIHGDCRETDAELQQDQRALGRSRSRTCWMSSSSRSRSSSRWTFRRRSGRTRGCQEVFNSVFPITDSREMFSLEFVSYMIGDPKYSVEECQERDLTYSVPLKVKLRLRVREEVDGVKRDKAITETDVYLGELPMITEKGTFIINGAERVIVSQLHRSPGVFFDSRSTRTGRSSTRRASSRTGDLGGVLDRCEGHHVRPHRPQAEAARDGSAQGARHRHRPGHPRLLLREGRGEGPRPAIEEAAGADRPGGGRGRRRHRDRARSSSSATRS